MDYSRAKQGSEIYDAIVAVLCKEHFKRVAVRPDIKLIHTIAEAAMQSRHRHKKKRYMNSQRNTAKISGNTKYLYAMMDYQTRFIIAQQVADSRIQQTLHQSLVKQKRLLAHDLMY